MNKVGETLMSESASETRQTILRDMLVPIIVAGIVSGIAAALTIYANQGRFGDRLDRVEGDVAVNTADIKANNEAMKALVDRLTDRVSSVANDVSWIRGKLEQKGAP